MSDETYKLNRLKRWLSPIKSLTHVLYILGVIWLIVFLIADQNLEYLMYSSSLALIGLTSHIIWLLLDRKIDKGLNKEKWRDTLHNTSKH